MDKPILQSLLDAQVFTLPDNDDRLTQLEASATQLAKRLQENVADISFYTLVALDPKIAGTEPVITEVEDVIKENWATLRSNRPESPVSIVRSVILSALHKIGIKDADYAQIIYLTATNFYPYAVLGNEKEIVENIFLNIGKIAEESANEEWALANEIPTLKLPTLKVTPIKIDKSLSKDDLSIEIPTLTQHPSYANNVAFLPPIQQAFNNLAKEVPERITTALKGLTLTASLVDFNQSLEKFFSDFKNLLDKELKSSFTAMQAVERRSRLLWWKEALYSQHLKKSYREIDRELRPILLAFDLYNQLPNITPVSVDYLLRDTLFQLNDKTDETIKFSDILSAIENSPNKALLEDCFNANEVDNKDRRITISDFIYLLVKGEVKTKDLLKFTGIDPKKTVTSCELSVMVLHDLLSNRIAES